MYLLGTSTTQSIRYFLKITLRFSAKLIMDAIESLLRDFSLLKMKLKQDFWREIGVLHFQK